MLTQLAAEKAAPRAKRYEIPDGKVPGLYLSVTPSGAKSFVVRYRVAGRSVKHTLGKLAAIPLKDARELARAALVAVAGGRDPHAEKVTARRTKTRPPELDLFQNVAEEFLVACRAKIKDGNMRDSTLHEYRRVMQGYIVPAWKGRPIKSIERRDVREMLAEIEAPVMRNRVLQLTRTFFNWALSQDKIDAAPTAGIEPSKEKSRDRVLTDAELRALWVALDAEQYPVGPIIKLLLLTGARRSEIEQMQWREIDLDERVWLLPSERSKNGRERLTPLTDQAIAILDKLPRIGGGDFVFTLDGLRPFGALSSAKRRLDGQLAFDPRWTLHDIRRSVATGMQKPPIKTKPHVISAVLGHTIVSGVGGIYSRYDYFDEKREALAAWAAFLMRNSRQLRAVS